MTFNKTNCGSTHIASLMMLTLFAFSMEQTVALGDNILFGGRGIQNSCGHRADRNAPQAPEELVSGQPSGLITLNANSVLGFTFEVEGELNSAECTTTGSSNVDLYMCTKPNGSDCTRDPSLLSAIILGDDILKVTSSIGAQTWYVFVKTKNAPATFTVTCEEKLLGLLPGLPGLLPGLPGLLPGL